MNDSGYLRGHGLVFVVLLTGFVFFEWSYLGDGEERVTPAVEVLELPEADPLADELVFGVYQTDKASVVHAMFRPVLDALQRAVRERTESAVRIELRVFRSYESGRRALVDGVVDMARFGPASYVLAAQDNPGISLIAIEEIGGQRSFRGLIVVRQESPWRSLEELTGHRFAFGDRNSTVGRYLSQALLAEAGVLAGDLAHHEYLGRHDLVYKSVELGDFDAGAVKESTFHELNQDSQLRVLARFDVISKPWLARSGLDPELLGALRGALRGMDDPAALRALGASGLSDVEPSAFDGIRRAMQAAEVFERG